MLPHGIAVRKLILSGGDGYCGMKLPKLIKIGALTYDVLKYKFLGEELSGQCDSDKQIIRIDDKDADNVVVNTLLHECLHGIYRDRGLIEGDDEERIVAAFANGIQALLRDNRDLWKLL